MDLQTQFIILVYSFFVGIYLGVTYDLLYYFLLIHLKKIFKYVCDIIFFILQGFIVFFVIYDINSGIIPFYSYFIMALGVFVYYYFSKQYYKNTILPFKIFVYSIIKKVLRVLKFIFIKPFIDNYLFLRSIFLYVRKKIIKFYKLIKFKFNKMIKIKKKQKTNTIIKKKKINPQISTD